MPSHALLALALALAISTACDQLGTSRYEQCTRVAKEFCSVACSPTIPESKGQDPKDPKLLLDAVKFVGEWQRLTARVCRMELGTTYPPGSPELEDRPARAYRGYGIEGCVALMRYECVSGIKRSEVDYTLWSKPRR